MYQRFYGLRELPFDLTPNPRYLFLTARHREALSNLHYGIGGRRGITLLIGEAGTGKTTLVRSVLQAEWREKIQCIHLNNPMLSRSEFLEFLADAFELGERAAGSKAVLLRELEAKLLQRHAEGIVTALLVDEAQALSPELLEEVRLLSNIETTTDKLLPVVLAGQPQLAERLNHPDLRQLKQRVALRCELRPLDLGDTAAYIAGRIRTAGGNGTRLFTREAVELIHACSKGIPRTISVLCDNALVSGFAAQQRPVARELVREVCIDFDLEPPEAAPSPEVIVPEAAAPMPAVVEKAERPEAARDVPSYAAAGASMFTMFNRPRRLSFF